MDKISPSVRILLLFNILNIKLLVTEKELHIKETWYDCQIIRKRKGKIIYNLSIIINYYFIIGF